MTNYRIALIHGDGIGPEQTEATTRVLDAVQERFGVDLDLVPVEAGDRCFEKRGTALPDETVKEIKASDACLKAPVGETAADVIVKLRRLLDLYANIRPIKAYPEVPSFSPDIDFVFVRENTEDVYRGIEFLADENTAVCIRIITKRGSERIARYAFELARDRAKKMQVTMVHKRNVMKISDGLFADTCKAVSKDYPDVKLDELYVDNAAMQIVKRPEAFDVIVTTNMFGDILSDEASMVVGGLGMGPGANIGDNYGLFEPIHGSAPKYAGLQVANPCSMILSARMMFDWLGRKHSDPSCKEASKSIEEVMVDTIKAGIRTQDLGGTAKTLEVGEAIAKTLRRKKYENR